MEGQGGQQTVAQQQQQQQQQAQVAAAQQQQQQAQVAAAQQQQAQQQQALLVNTANIQHQMQVAVVQGVQGGGSGGGGGDGLEGQVVSSPAGGQQQAQQQQQQALLVNTANIQHQMQMSTPQSPLCSAGNTISTIQAQGTISQQQVQNNTAQPQIQQVSDWNTQRVQVLQQPVSNTAYVQQVYNTAQGQMLMSGNLGNIALHTAPPNMNPSIQVITAGKPFQSNQITSHVLGKPVLGTQQTSFPSYATIPTTTNQTLVIGQLGVISSQPSILPHSQQKQSDLQKYVTATCQNRGLTTATSNGVQLPWQFNTAQLPQVWATPHHPQVITAQNPIFIRGPHQEQPMFIQSPPPQQQQQQVQQQVTQNVTMSKSNTEMKGSSPQVQVSRTLSILPSVAASPAAIRPATVAPAQNQHVYPKQQIKTQKKTIYTKTNVPIQKLDAQNQTKPISPQQPKMIITSQGTVVPQQTVQPAQQEKQVLQPQQVLQPKPPPLMSITVPADMPSPKDQSTQPVAVAAPLEQTVLIAEKPVLEATAIIQQADSPIPVSATQDSNAKQDMEEESLMPLEEKSGPPKAMVKPQVLTHVIEGYVIQESSEPFPINRNPVLASELTPVRSSIDSNDEPPFKKAKEDVEDDGKKAKCEVCGIIDLREKFRKGKRFCSAQCAKKGSQGKKGKEDEYRSDEVNEKKDWDNDTNDSSNSVPDLSDIKPPNIPDDPSSWGVDEVCEFIKNLPGCKEYVEDFASQEIDGQALLLLKEDHLMSAMSMKLGPALKICARIDAMRTKAEQHS